MDSRLKTSGMTEGGLKAGGMTEGMLCLFVMPRHSSVMRKDVVTHMGVVRRVFLGSL